ncbi:MAG TPA: hypothetical protein EYO61_00675, partial [Campylobacterales bacterium]|nr:hypothetical protein [Campylobacterales bacterium]
MNIVEIIQSFKQKEFYEASIDLFQYLKVPLNIVSEDAIDVNGVFGEYRELSIIDRAYIVGGVDDAIFQGKKSDSDLKVQRYEGLLIFAIELNIENPTRTELANISRIFNRSFEYTPIVLLFKYGNRLSLSNTQRQPYTKNQKWRGGEKVGKVSILRDIDIDNPHRGHLDILESMKIPENVDSYESLYQYWQEVFDIELLQKRFYNELFEIFEELVNSLEYPKDSWQKKQDFIVRLIGRVLFLKFLEKKGVISSDKFKLREDYYHNTLEPLFFKILNKPIEERNSRLLEKGDKNIPFLNGGLFEPYEEDYYNSDSWNTLKVSDNSLGKLIKLLEKYYFTVDENTSLDNEIGLDPELLGMVFENLIGYINPETQESARKETGSFYTPREIVEFMVSNSILEYLKIETNIKEEKLQDLIFYHKNSQIEFEDKLDILRALNSVKILDPACGSGAFPMGILNKIVEILNLIDIDAKEWLNLQSRDFQKRHKGKAPDYIRKLSIIQNSIFGVDIQPIAVEIAKLRFFLSLLVDEDKDKIEPLPNMEFKIVCANTLLPLEKKESLASGRYFELEKELKEIKKEYFFSTEKAKLRERFIKIQNELKKELNLDFDNKIIDYDPFSPSSQAQFFDSNYMFQEDSFNIIIGNPPYIRQEKIKPLKNEIARINKTKSAPIYRNGKHYLTYNGTADIYVYFFEKGYQLLKVGGVLSFITSNKYTRAKYGKNLRDFLLSNTPFLNYLDFNGVRVFKRATVDTSILTFKKVRSNRDSSLGENIGNEFIYCDIDSDYTKEPLIDFISKKGVKYSQKDLSIDGFSFASPFELKIKKAD